MALRWRTLRCVAGIWHYVGEHYVVWREYDSKLVDTIPLLGISTLVGIH